MRMRDGPKGLTCASVAWSAGWHLGFTEGVGDGRIAMGSSFFAQTFVYKLALGMLRLFRRRTLTGLLGFITSPDLVENRSHAVSWTLTVHSHAPIAPRTY